MLFARSNSTKESPPSSTARNGQRTRADKECIRHCGTVLHRPQSNFHVADVALPFPIRRICRAAAVVASVVVIVGPIDRPVDRSAPSLSAKPDRNAAGVYPNVTTDSLRPE